MCSVASGNTFIAWFPLFTYWCLHFTKVVTAKKTRLWAYTLAVVILGFVHATIDMSSETGRGEQNETAAVCISPHCINLLNATPT